MALISCKECGKEISSEAVTCPHCGAKTTHGKQVNEQKNLGVAGVVYIIMAVVGFFLLISGFTALLDDMESWGRYHYGTYSFTDIEGEVLMQIILGISLFAGGVVGALGVTAKMGYTYGTLQPESEPDGLGYEEQLNKKYGIVSEARDVSLQDITTWKIQVIHVWNTRNGIKVACDSKGNYVHTTKMVSDNKLASVLMDHK